MKSFLLFNNKGGVGKTTLLFNLAHMLAGVGHRVVVADYDPQCNVTAIFLNEDELSDVWDAPAEEGKTVYSCLELLHRQRGEIREPALHEAGDNLWLLPGHMALGRFEQRLAEEWPKKADTENEYALNATTALDRLSNWSAEQVNADFVMLDVGPSLGALNRSALLACDAVIMPIAPDLFSMQGLRNVGPTLREWRKDWTTTRERHLDGRTQAQWPKHDFLPIGYIVQQHIARADRPVTAYKNWLGRIPKEYHDAILDEKCGAPERFEEDPECLGLLRHFASLAPFAQSARKPMFELKQADGVGGGQLQAVAKCRTEFKALSEKLIARLK